MIFLGYLLAFLAGAVAGSLGILYVITHLPRWLGAVFNANPKG